jgi:predicted amidohydrolase YtcJ
MTTSRSLSRFVAAYLLLFSAACQKPMVDLLLVNANIYTVDSSFSTAQAMAISNGKIVETGSSGALQLKYKAAKTIDARGKHVYPGFIDAHCHFVRYAAGLAECNLTGTTSWSDAVETLEQFAKQQSADTGWLIGRGWDQNDWDNKAFPTNTLLNQRFPNRPVLLTRVDGHAAIANQAALALAAIKPFQQLTGGKVLTQNGALTGLLVDNATALVQKWISLPDSAATNRLLVQAQANCFAAGLTGLHDCGLDAQELPQLQALYARQALSIRLNVMLSDKPENYAWAWANGKIESPTLRVASFKLYADGALGSRGACLLQPYTDDVNNRGFLLKPTAYFDSILPIIAQKGWQACTHAIGDSANRWILKTYGRVLAGQPNHRWRIEHAQVVSPDDFEWFGRGGVVPSVQPTHATSDMYWAEQRLGTQRLAGAYAFQQLLRQLGWLPLGTDFPVEDISPLKTFYAATARKDAVGRPTGGYLPQNALNRLQALRGITIWAAKAACEEGVKGSLEAGKFADFVVLDTDLMTAPEENLLKAKVLETWVGGKRVF